MTRSVFFGEFLCFFNVLVVLNRIRVDRLVETAFVKSWLARRVERIFPSRIFRLLELIHVFLDKAFIFSSWSRRRIEKFVGERTSLAGRNASYFIGSWFRRIDHFFLFLFRKSSFRFEELCFLFLFILGFNCFWKFTHNIWQKIFGTLWWLLNLLFFLFLFIVFLIILFLLHFLRGSSSLCFFLGSLAYIAKGFAYFRLRGIILWGITRVFFAGV